MNQKLDKSLRCRAFRRHKFDGHVFLEGEGKSTVWVAKLQCSYCDSWRIDRMVPVTCELISRQYFPDEDYDTELDSQKAKQILFKEMLQK